MAAFAVVQVAGFTDIEVSGWIAIDLAIDITMLEIGIRMSFFTAIVIGGRKVIDASAGF